MVQVGDQVVLESERVGQPSQTGVIIDTRGQLVHVRWDDGKESSYIPSAGALRVIGHESEDQRQGR
jgi:hypothetical protein